MPTGIVDFKKKGNVVRFYIGDTSKEYWGDDWDDTPYECNAGEVYDEFVTGHIDFAFPFDWFVLEPCDGEWNSRWCKEDFKERRTPCIIAGVPREDSYGEESYKTELGREDIYKFYFGDDANQVIAKNVQMKEKYDVYFKQLI